MKLPEKLGVRASESAKREYEGGLGYIVSFLAITMTLYHLYVAIFGLPEWLITDPCTWRSSWPLAF